MTARRQNRATPSQPTPSPRPPMRGTGRLLGGRLRGSQFEVRCTSRLTLRTVPSEAAATLITQQTRTQRPDRATLTQAAVACGPSATARLVRTSLASSRAPSTRARSRHSWPRRKSTRRPRPGVLSPAGTRRLARRWRRPRQLPPLLRMAGRAEGALSPPPPLLLPAPPAALLSTAAETVACLWSARARLAVPLLASLCSRRHRLVPSE